jgi:alginate O-acetyltransferase complex protein AlgI
MLFNSFSYILVFLPVAALLHVFARETIGRRAAQTWLLISSLVFYAWPKPSNLGLLIGSASLNWMISRLMGSTEEPRHRKRLLQLGLVVNIALLCSFKYVNFLLRTLASLGGSQLSAPNWEFPLGISFFTLQQVMYLVDCYESLIPPNGLLDHATFVSFFPYVTAGPITRAKNMISQFQGFIAHGEGRSSLAATGLYLFTLGLFKKIFFADTLGLVADVGFAGYEGLSTIEAWACSIAYTLQIYFDFSGYSDMARGSALILGFEIPCNFNSPYRSRSIIEFWQRWHITLSNFITNYLYTPMLRSFKRVTLATASFSTLCAMMIAGLWHGPSWTFVVFGTLHGMALVVNQFWNKKVSRRLPIGLAWALTFAFVNLAFIFFRAPSLSVGGHIARLLIPVHTTLLGIAVLRDAATGGTIFILPIIIGIIAAFWGKNSDELARAFRPSYVTALGTAALMLVSWFFMNSTIVKRFVYFAF